MCINVLLYWCNGKLNRIELKQTHGLFLFHLPVDFITPARLDIHYDFADASRLHKRKCGFELCRLEPALRKQGLELAIIDELCRFGKNSAEARLTNAC
jgi:hypothetical protein